ncbi:lysophospholipid acyltransferase [Ascosphaera pollenicola]|nr:lysophospholipid acyltransferase [Ascosphaera pollenicola]
MDFERGHAATQNEDGAHLHSLRLVPSCDRSFYSGRADAPVPQSIKLVNDGGFSPYADRSRYGSPTTTPYTNGERDNQLHRNHFRSFSDDFGVDAARRDSGNADLDTYANESLSSSPNVLVHSTSFQTESTSGPAGKASFTSCESSPNVVVLGSSPPSKYPVQFSSPNYVRLMPSESSMLSAEPQSEDHRQNNRISPLQPLSPITLRSGADSSPLEVVLYSDIIPSPPRLSRSKSNWSGHSRRHTVASQSSMIDFMLDIGSPALKSRTSQEQQLDTLLALVEGRGTIARKSHLSMGQLSTSTSEEFGSNPEPKPKSSVHIVSDNEATTSPTRQPGRHHRRNLSEAVILEEEQFLRPSSSSRTTRCVGDPSSAGHSAEQGLRPTSAHSAGGKSLGGRSSSSTGLTQWATRYYEGPSRGPSLFARSSSSTTTPVAEGSSSRKSMQIIQSEAPETSNLELAQNKQRDSVRNSKHETVRTLKRDSIKPPARLQATATDSHSTSPDPETHWSYTQEKKCEELPLGIESGATGPSDSYAGSRCSNDAGRWSPHLSRDRAARNHLVFVEPVLPPNNSEIEYPYRNRRRIQMMLFVLGFICPVLWFVGAIMRLPKRESAYCEKRISTENGVFTGEDPYLENARWWRRKNRYMCPLGALILVVISNSNEVEG